MNLPQISGIYKITNNLNGLYYIGSSVNVKKRYNGHFSKLRANKHANFHLQSAFNKYGESVFVFEVLEDCLGQSVEELRATEQKHIDSIIDWSDCYNIQKQTTVIVSPLIGELTRQKMSANSKGERNPNFGKRHSEEMKLEMSEMKRVRGAGVKSSESGVWVVDIKLLNQKKSLYLGTYEEESTARKVKYLSEKLYWDGDTSIEEEFNSLRLLAKTLTATARKRGTGVTLTPDNTWKVNITVNNKRIHLGIYKTEQLARTVRDLAEKVYWDNDESLLPELELAKSKANTQSRKRS